MKKILLIMALFCVTSCGFKPRGAMPLAPPLHQLYLETPDPYGQLTRNLKQFLKISGVQLTNDATTATAILTILNETTSDQLLGINGTQQTRQYNLILTVNFQVSNPKGRIIVPAQIISESRALTITNDQILASNNEAMNLYAEMRRVIVYDIMSRLSSNDITASLTEANTTPPPTTPKKSHKKSSHKPVAGAT